MTATSGPEVGDILLKASYQKEEADIPAGFAGVFGRIADSYFQRYGDQSDALAAIAAKNHKNGVDNPFAQMRKDLGFDFCRNVSEKNPYVAPPLKRTDCSLVSDGAAALVLADEETARSLGKAVRFRAAVQVNDFLPISKRDITRFEGAAEAWARALSAADMKLEDLSFVESHDCFTIAELLEYEAMGLTKPGQGARAVLEGWTAKDGRLPVNPSGGLKAKGHPIGATGVSMHAITAMQLTGQAPRACNCQRPIAARCSTWAALRSRITSRSWSRCADPDQQPRTPVAADREALSRPSGADLARYHLDLGRLRRPDAAGSRGAGGAWRAAWRPCAAARPQFQCGAGDDVRLLDAGRSVGADELSPYPARGGLPRTILGGHGAYF